MTTGENNEELALLNYLSMRKVAYMPQQKFRHLLFERPKINGHDRGNLRKTKMETPAKSKNESHEPSTAEGRELVDASWWF
jgi:hypothetical protein